MSITWILLKASLLLSTAVLAHGLLGKRVSATSRHLLWTFAIVGLLVLPILSGLLRLPASRFRAPSSPNSSTSSGDRSSILRRSRSRTPP